MKRCQRSALKKLFKLQSNRQLELVRAGADEQLAVKRGAQANHMGRRRQMVAKAFTHVVDLAFDGVSGDRTTGPALGHHGAKPNIKQVKKGLLL